MPNINYYNRCVQFSLHCHKVALCLFISLLIEHDFCLYASVLFCAGFDLVVSKTSENPTTLHVHFLCLILCMQLFIRAVTIFFYYSNKVRVVAFYLYLF